MSLVLSLSPIASATAQDPMTPGAAKLLFDVMRGGEIEEPPVSPAATEEVIVGEEENYTTTPKLIVTKEDELFALSSTAKDGESLRSKRTVKTPFTLKARAMTSGNSLRFYFCQRGIVVFNWEGNPKEMRVNEPVGSIKHGIPDTKPLDPNRMYDLEIQVTESRIEIYAGKRKYAEVEGNFADAEGIVGIGPAFGGKVSVERFAVTPLPTTSAPALQNR